MLFQINMWPVVESGSPNGFVIESEPESADQVKSDTRSGAESGNGSNVGCNIRFD